MSLSRLGKWWVFISEGQDLESPFCGGGTGRKRGGASGILLGGKGEGRERVSIFLPCFLSSFPPSFLPSFLARHDQTYVCAFSLFHFLFLFSSFLVKGGDASARAWYVDLTLYSPPYNLGNLRFALSILHFSFTYLLIHSSISFMFMYEESCTEVYNICGD